MKKQIIKECLRIAKDKLHRHPEPGNRKHYTFIVQDHKILGYGMNKSPDPFSTEATSDLINLGYFKHSKIHSEIAAFRRVKGLIDRSKNFEIVNIRLNKLCQLCISAPCPCCFQNMKAVGCSHFYFSTADGFAKICAD